MNLEQALNTWLSNLTGLDSYWLQRAKHADNAVVYRCISPGFIPGNLRKTGVREDSYSLTIYHQAPDRGKEIADQIANALDQFTGELNPGTEQAYRIQLAQFSGGFDQWLENETHPIYQFNRDFVINH